MQVTTETLKCPDICYRCCWCSGGRSLLWRQSEERMTYQGHHDRRLGLPSSTAWKTDLFDWDQSHLWWFKGIVRWEVDSQEEHTSLIRTVRLKDKRAKFKHPPNAQLRFKNRISLSQNNAETNRMNLNNWRKRALEIFEYESVWKDSSPAYTGWGLWVDIQNYCLNALEA